MEEICGGCTANLTMAEQEFAEQVTMVPLSTGCMDRFTFNRFIAWAQAVKRAG